MTVRRDGEAVADLQPYLGALGHLVAIRGGDLAYLHVHPLDASDGPGGPSVRFAVDAYVTFARTRPWVEAIASGLTEMFSGHLMRRRVGDMLAHYDWIAAEDLAYFTNRIEAVSGEGRKPWTAQT